jgi:glucan phosphoethanolaminetransferase (alkaline phosphatase superfamily)
MILIIEIIKEFGGMFVGAVLTFVLFSVVMSKRKTIDSALSNLITINKKMYSYYKGTKVIAIFYGLICSFYLVVLQFFMEIGGDILVLFLITAIWVAIQFTKTNPNLALIFFPLLSILTLCLSLFLGFLRFMPFGGWVLMSLVLILGILLGVFGGIMWKIMRMPFPTKKEYSQKIDPIQPNQDTVKTCQKCGAQIFPNTEFCGECGTRIVN